MQPADQPSALHPPDASLEACPQIIFAGCAWPSPLELVEQVVGGAQQAAPLLLLDQEALDRLEQRARADHRQRVPLDAISDRLGKLGDLPAFLRARLEEAIQAKVGDYRIDAVPAHGYAAAIGPGRDEVRPQRDRGVAFQAPGL